MGWLAQKKVSWEPSLPRTATTNLGCSPPPSLTVPSVWALLLHLQDGWTPLHGAAAFGLLEVVRQLLGAGASVDAVDKVRPTDRSDGQPPMSVLGRLHVALAAMKMAGGEDEGWISWGESGQAASRMGGEGAQWLLMQNARHQ
jgi:hypothetical protein